MLLNEEIREQLTAHFSGLKKDVYLKLVAADCDTCPETKSLLEEVESLSDLLHVEVVAPDSELAKSMNIDRSPVIFFVDENGEDLRIRFNGIPAGHEFSAFITVLSEVGGMGEEVPEEIMTRIQAIDQPTTIKVFVTLGCPHCSGAVAKAHLLALNNPNIRSEMIECGTFNEIAQKYNVSSVPKIVVNEKEDFLGNQPIDAFLEAIESAK